MKIFKYLLIEDSKNIIGIFKKTVKEYVKTNCPNCKMEIEIIKSVKEYKEKCINKSFNLCTLDWRLEDGFSSEIIENISKTCKTVVIISGYAEDQNGIGTDIRECIKKYNIKLVEQKPIRLRRFEEILDKVLQHEHK